jgi:small nuclear ribonucleoprotein (snRNP)-like protein
MAHKHKGGAGVVGKVTKIEGSTVYIKNKEGREFKGQLKNVSDI